MMVMSMRTADLRWIKLAKATGLDRERVMRGDEVLPSTAVYRQ